MPLRTSIALRGAPALFTLCLVFAVTAQAGESLTPLEALGKHVFFDRISSTGKQACASCHDPRAGWTAPRSRINALFGVMPGAVRPRTGNRKPPAVSYASFSPDKQGRMGGNFWDGRATGDEIRSSGVVPFGHDHAVYLGPTADQAMKPFENPVEQNIDASDVCRHVEASGYAGLYEEAWNRSIDCTTLPGGYDAAFMMIAVSIAAYEASSEVNSFSSRFDSGELTPIERDGLDLFRGKGQCSGCHRLSPGTEPGDGSLALFTNFMTFNIGVPRNPRNPWYRMDRVYGNDGEVINPQGENYVDRGDGDGRFKTPTLRNVDKRPHPRFVKAYTHNGYFKSLKGIVHFYNTRDTKPVCAGDYSEARAMRHDCWPAPEVPQNVVHSGVDPDAPGIGDLGLTDDEEMSIVAFLSTLSDRLTPTPPIRDRHDDRGRDPDERHDHDRRFYDDRDEDERDD